MHIRARRQSEPQAPVRGCLWKNGAISANTHALAFDAWSVRRRGRGALSLQSKIQNPKSKIAPAFTLVELLVVVAILVLLAGLIASGASRLFQQQKIRATQQAMSNMLLAIDNFSKENPLRLTYDSRDGATFGPYPPYMLANRTFPVPAQSGRNLADLFDRDYAPSGTPYTPDDYTLTHRLGRDLGDRNPPINGPTEWVNLAVTPASVVDDDNRALYAYIATATPASLNLVPDRNRAALSSLPEYVNRRGTGTQPNDRDRTDVLGFVDAWGVPFDYFLYVKIEWGVTRNANTGLVTTDYRIIDRVPVIRSRGVDLEKYKQWVDSNPNNPNLRAASLLDPSRQVLSSELPRPYANVADIAANQQTGDLVRTNQAQSMRANGWLRLVAGSSIAGREYQDDAKYRPD
jgi:prepilin-type N-terminal cleavage/methylation domain-containing protein